MADYNRTETEFTATVTYDFNLTENNRGKYLVESIGSRESITEINNSNGTLSVETAVSQSVRYQFVNNEIGQLTKFQPTVEVYKITNTDGQMKFRADKQRYPDYSSCIVNASVRGDNGVYAAQNTIIIHPDVITTDPYIFSNETQTELFAYGNLDKKMLQDINTVFSQTSKYVNMTPTSRINLHISPELDPSGLAVYRGGNSTEVFIGGNGFDKYVLSHEIAHTMQTFYTTSKTRWVMRGVQNTFLVYSSVRLDYHNKGNKEL